MAATTTITTRIDENVKRDASEALDATGLTSPGAVNMFLTRVANERAFPFELRVPNAATRAAMAEADEIVVRRAARYANPQEMMEELEAAREQIARFSSNRLRSHEGVREGLGSAQSSRSA